MENNLYKILLHIENNEFEIGVEETTSFITKSPVMIAEKLLAYGEIYYASLQLELFDLEEIKELQNQLLSTIKLESVKYKTSEIALYHSALSQSNMIVKFDNNEEILKQLRDYIFNNNIIKGTLVEDAGCQNTDSSILKSCVPATLFEPEDLIVVAGYQDILEMNLSSLQDATNITLYAVDKREIVVATKYLQILENNYSNTAEYKLCKLRFTNYFGEEIIHKPYGNNHPYKTELFERTPRNVFEDDEIKINFVGSNLSETKLSLTVDGDTTILKPIISTNEIEYGTFEVGKIPAGCKVKYKLFNNNYQTEEFEFIVDKQISNLSIKQVSNNVIEFNQTNTKLYIMESNDRIILTTNGENSGKQLEINNGQIKLSETLELDIADIQFSLSGTDRISYKFKMNQPTNLFGFGERYNSIIQGGETIDTYVFSQYKDQGIKTYVPMPLAFSNRDFGIFVNEYNNTQFDVSKTNVTVSFDDINCDITILKGQYAEQFKTLRSIVGKPEKLSKWALGPWMSSNNWDSQAEVIKQKNLTLDLDIPSTVLVIEQWSDESTFYIFNDATYDEKYDGIHKMNDYTNPENGRWPNPKQMVDELHEADLKCILWQIPVIKYVPNIRNLQKNMDEKFAIDNDYVVKHQDGRPYRIAEDWFKDSLVVDLSNPAARKWWFDKRDYLVNEIGIDGFKTDGGECLFGNDIVMYGQRDSRKVRNYYPETYIKSYYDYLKEQKDSMTFSRAGYIGASSYPAHWAGDERSTFDAFDRTLKAGINASLSGIVYWGWDLAGFNGDIPTDELFIRSTAFATFCPIMQYHAESKGEYNQDRTPWNIAERTNNSKVIDIYRYYAHLRMQLIPYIDYQVSKSIDDNQPLMRAMMIEHKDDSACEIDDQYYFGDAMLVAPITKEGDTTRSVKLFEDKMISWVDLCYYDAGEYEIDCEVSEIPVFLRFGKLIPINLSKQLGCGMLNSDYENYQNLKFIYTGGDAKIEYDGYEVEITNGQVHTNKAVKIIDLSNSLVADQVAEVKWNKHTVVEKEFENE